MENLKIPSTEYSFEIDFNWETGILEMAGSSYPENAMDFFQPIFKWLETYTEGIREPFVLNLRFEYLNTSSTKCMIDILELLEKYINRGGKVEVNWYYEEDDEDILETGQDLMQPVADGHWSVQGGLLVRIDRTV